MTSTEVACPRCSAPMVIRRARHGKEAGRDFWGCSNYPRCRQIIDIADRPFSALRRPDAPSIETVETASGGAVVGTAGASARRIHQRRLERDNERRAERSLDALPRVGALVVVLGVFLWPSSPALAILVGVMGAASIVLQAIAPRATTKAWDSGATGEEVVGPLLDGLADDGWVIVHDRALPWSTANIDHVAIGPTGVFVIETKNHAGQLRIRGDEVRIRGRKIDVVAEVRREADAVWGCVERVLGPRGLRVRPIICAVRANLPFFRRSVAGVPIVSARELLRALRSGHEVLSPSEIRELRQLIESGLRPRVKGS